MYNYVLNNNTYYILKCHKSDKKLANISATFGTGVILESDGLFLKKTIFVGLHFLYSVYHLATVRTSLFGIKNIVARIFYIMPVGLMGRLFLLLGLNIQEEGFNQQLNL